MNKDTISKRLRRLLLSGGRISVHFRNCNIALFALAFFLMVMAMLGAFYNIIRQVSAAYAERYASSSADAFSAHIAKEIALMSKAARSGAVIDWLTDERDDEKKILAYGELSGIVGELYSNNLYIGFEASRHEYRVNKNFTSDDIQPFATLSEHNPDDVWYFHCIASDKDYTLSIGIDHVLQRKRVWLDYKIVKDGATIGVLCTGLEFAHVAEELFSSYNNVVRGFIIDSNGIINMDSSLLDNDSFMRYDFEAQIEDVLTDPGFIEAVKSHLDNTEDYFKGKREPAVIKLSPGPYRYVTIASIRHTNWSAVVLYDSSSSFNVTLFLPAFITMLVLLIAFALANNAISYRFIFLPLKNLVGSLARLKDNKDEPIYGLERDDEFGNLSNTIQDLFTKANRDALTGIYNRRFMENSLRDVMEFLSRSGGLLSVLMLDVDYFKKYNDTYGHEQGDVCLKAVAQALADSVIRASDFVARYGGEEFVAVLPNTDEAGARGIAQKLLENVRKLNLPHANNTVAPYVTVSVGVTTGTVTYTQNWEDYVKCADKALYMSKQNGRNQYTYSVFE